jgi:hypothetical protein
MNKNTVARNILLLEELEKILKKFNEENIEVILLKGCSLLGRIYSDLSQREMEDIDFLVRGEDMPQIKKILSGLGYRQLPAGDWEFVKIYSEHFPPIMLDLQEKIWYIKGIKKIWEEALTVEIGQVKTKVLSPEEEIIFLTAHRIVHRGQLDKICLQDIEKVISHYQDKISWEKMVGKIGNYGLSAPVYLIFSKIESIPSWVKKAIKPKSVLGGLFPWLLKLFSYSQENENIGHFLRPLTFPTLFGKIKFLFSFFFPGKDFLIRRYGIKNKSVVFFYYFFRPVILVFKGLESSTKSLAQFVLFNFLSIRYSCKKNKVLV